MVIADLFAEARRKLVFPIPYPDIFIGCRWNQDKHQAEFLLCRKSLPEDRRVQVTFAMTEFDFARVANMQEAVDMIHKRVWEAMNELQDVWEAGEVKPDAVTWPLA